MFSIFETDFTVGGDAEHIMDVPKHWSKDQIEGLVAHLLQSMPFHDFKIVEFPDSLPKLPVHPDHLV